MAVRIRSHLNEYFRLGFIVLHNNQQSVATHAHGRVREAGMFSKISAQSTCDRQLCRIGVFVPDRPPAMEKCPAKSVTIQPCNATQPHSALPIHYDHCTIHSFACILFNLSPSGFTLQFPNLPLTLNIHHPNFSPTVK